MSRCVIWLDDIRNPEDYEVYDAAWTDTYKNFSEWLSVFNLIVSEIHLDHDLGEPGECGTGYDALLLIEEMLYSGYLQSLRTVYIHTSNPSAANKMMSVKDIFRDKFNVEVKRNYYS